MAKRYIRITQLLFLKLLTVLKLSHSIIINNIISMSRTTLSIKISIGRIKPPALTITTIIISVKSTMFFFIKIIQYKNLFI